MDPSNLHSINSNFGNINDGSNTGEKALEMVVDMNNTYQNKNMKSAVSDTILISERINDFHSYEDVLLQVNKNSNSCSYSKAHDFDIQWDKESTNLKVIDDEFKNKCKSKDRNYKNKKQSKFVDYLWNRMEDDHVIKKTTDRSYKTCFQYYLTWLETEFTDIDWYNIENYEEKKFKLVTRDKVKKYYTDVYPNYTGTANYMKSTRYILNKVINLEYEVCERWKINTDNSDDLACIVSHSESKQTINFLNYSKSESVKDLKYLDPHKQVKKTICRSELRDLCLCWAGTYPQYSKTLLDYIFSVIWDYKTLLWFNSLNSLIF